MVWVVDGGRLEARPVVVRALREDRVQVTGVREGELVVGLGVQKLDEGSRVRVVQALGL